MAKRADSKIFYGYIIVAVSLFILIIMDGIKQSYSVFFASLQKELAADRAMISSANSLVSLVGGVSGIALGRLVDRFGPKLVVVGSALLIGAGYFLMSKVTSLWQLFLFYSVLGGIGVSSGNVTLLPPIARWFVKRRGLMTGIVKIGSGLGQAIVPLVAGMLITGFGWRETCIMMGILGVVGIIPIAQLLKHDPHEMGLDPYGVNAINRTSSELSNRVQLSLRGCIKTHQFWIVCAAYFLTGYITQSIMVHIVSYAMDGGVATVQAASVLSAIGALSIAGRLVLGSAGDKIGNRWVLIVCFIFLTIALSWLQFANRLWMLYAFALVYGFGHGGFFAVMSPLVAELFGTTHQGVNLGVVLFLQAVGLALGPFVTGYTFDITHSYHLAFLILIIFSICALALSIAITPVKLTRKSLAIENSVS
jgi:MFS family permease